MNKLLEYIRYHKEEAENQGGKLVLACLGRGWAEVLTHAASEINRDQPDCIELVDTKKWGKSWCIDGVVVVLDPRVYSAGMKERAAVLRMDRTKKALEVA